MAAVFGQSLHNRQRMCVNPSVCDLVSVSTSFSVFYAIRRRSRSQNLVEADSVSWKWRRNGRTCGRWLHCFYVSTLEQYDIFKVNNALIKFLCCFTQWNVFSPDVKPIRSATTHSVDGSWMWHAVTVKTRRGNGPVARPRRKQANDFNPYTTAFPYGNGMVLPATREQHDQNCTQSH